MKDLKYYEEELEYERGRLHRLIMRAKSETITKNKELIKRGRKVDGLLNKIQKIKDKGKNKGKKE